MSWASTQQNIALSSAEGELYALVKGVCLCHLEGVAELLGPAALTLASNVCLHLLQHGEGDDAHEEAQAEVPQFMVIISVCLFTLGMFLLKQQHKQQQKHQDSTNISTVTPKNKPSISRRQTN